MEIRMTERMTMAAANSARSQHDSADLPTMHIVVRLEAAGAADGAATVTYAVEEASVLDGAAAAPAVRKRLEAYVARLKGTHGAWRQEPSGLPSAIDSGTPAATSSLANPGAAIADFVNGAGIIFPESEIGIGATWQVTSHGVASGVTWDKTSTYRLKNLSGEAATVEANAQMTASPQVLSVEPTRVVRLESGTGDESGDVTVSLHGLVPTGTYSGTSEANLSAVSGQQRVALTMQVETHSTVQPAGSASMEH
jgi:hypothetical protein